MILQFSTPNLARALVRWRTLALASLFAACHPGASGATLPAGFEEEKIAEGLNPTTMVFAPDGRLFLCEKHGLLRVVVDGRILESPILDLTAKVDGWNERGLLSVCFDPDFADNGWLYTYYTHNRDPGDESRQSSNNRVSRFTMTGNTVDPASETVIWELDNLSKIGWHNGGGLAFGSDGKLYLSTGENARAENAQDEGNLLGKLMRINKDGSIPPDNPNYRIFDGKSRAIVALGLRNPYQMEVQPETGILYLSEVGAKYEQIERYETALPPVATNYGWPGVDGIDEAGKLPDNYRSPEHAYDHGRGQGTAICAGCFYPSSPAAAGAFPAEYHGHFFFTDYGGWIKSIDPAEPSVRKDFAKDINRPIDVAAAPDGSLWYIERRGIPGGSDEANSESKDGILWRVRWTGDPQRNPSEESATPVPLADGLDLPVTIDGVFPESLSETGIFDLRRHSAISGAIPYSLNSPAWANGDEVRRWMIRPREGKIGFRAEGEFEWPPGTVFVQHFETGGRSQSEPSRPLETRILVVDVSGTLGPGASYRWQPDGSDASLVTESGRHGNREYLAGGQCYLCHTPAARFVLGPKAHQLNGGSGGENQLLSWSKRGLFTPASAPSSDSMPNLLRSVAIGDSRAPLEARVRSYLATNCASCHRPGGTGAGWDARFHIPLAGQGILRGAARNNCGIEGAEIVAPGDLAKSLLPYRMAATSAVEQMPPLDRTIPDERALEVIRQWIDGLPEN